jgi:hypothetical protein
MKYEVFTLSSPIKVLGIVEADSKHDAYLRARLRYGNDCGVVLIKKPIQESDMLPSPIALREDAALNTSVFRDAASGATFRVKASTEDEGKEWLRMMKRTGESLGLSEAEVVQFVKGRDGGDALEDVGRALGLEARLLEHFVKGRD